MFFLLCPCLPDPHARWGEDSDQLFDERLTCFFWLLWKLCAKLGTRHEPNNSDLTAIVLILSHGSSISVTQIRGVCDFEWWKQKEKEKEKKIKCRIRMSLVSAMRVAGWGQGPFARFQLSNFPAWPQLALIQCRCPLEATPDAAPAYVAGSAFTTSWRREITPNVICCKSHLARVSQTCRKEPLWWKHK